MSTYPSQEKVPITEKIKDKIGMGHKEDTTPADTYATTHTHTTQTAPYSQSQGTYATTPATGTYAPTHTSHATHTEGEKVPITEKIKDKLGMGHKDEAHATTTSAYQTHPQPEKKEGIVDKVKDALHMGGDKDKQVVDPVTGQRYEEKTHQIQRLEPVGAPGHHAPGGTSTLPGAHAPLTTHVVGAPTTTASPYGTTGATASPYTSTGTKY